MTEAPLRSRMPSVAWFALAMCVGSVVAEAAAWPDEPWHAAAVAGAAAVCTAVVWSAGRGWREQLRTLAVLACAGLVTGSALGALQSAQWLRQSALVGDCGAREWNGVVEADPMPGEFGAVVRVRVVGGPLDGAVVRVGWPSDVAVPDLGRTVRFAAILKPLPIEEGWARRSVRAGVCGSGNAWRAETGAWRPGVLGVLFAWRAGMLERMHSIRGPGADLAEGIVLGDRRRLLGTDTEEDFRILGLTHLVAVSGSHLAAACAAVAFIGTLLHIPRRPLVVATVAAGAVYAVVTGLPYSALRSLLMLAVGGVAQISGRRGDGVTSLAVAVIAVIALGPWAVFDLGFQLSALAVGGLLVFGRLADAWATAGFSGWRIQVARALSLTLVAQATTVPIVASAFGMVSLLAPLANVLVGPLVSVAMLTGLVGAIIGCVVPQAGALGNSAAASILGATAWIAACMAQIPGAAVALNGGPLLVAATGAAAVVLWMWWPLPRAPHAGRRFVAAALCGTLCVALGPAPVQRCTVTVLDVGQGDAILVRDSGRTMLVDAGPDALALRRALARHGIRRIDVLVLTHAHADHTGGAPGLVSVAEVGWIGVPGVTFGENDASAGTDRDPMPGSDGWAGPGCTVRRLAVGDTWRLGGMRVRVQWPPAETNEQLDANDTSVVLLLSRGAFDMVLTGDAEGLVQTEMIEAGTACEVEVLKVPHHGSVNGLTEEGLQAWRPNDAIISVGAGNEFSHPSPETLELLDGAGVRTFRTDFGGDIAVTVGREGYRVGMARSVTVAPLRARIAPVIDAVPSPAGAHSSLRSKGHCGSQIDRFAEACLSDLRRRGTAAGPRAPPAEGPHRRGRGPRFQLRGVFGRIGRRLGRRRCGEHPAVRL